MVVFYTVLIFSRGRSCRSRPLATAPSEILTGVSVPTGPVLLPRYGVTTTSIFLHFVFFCMHTLDQRGIYHTDNQSFQAALFVSLKLKTIIIFEEALGHM